MRLPFYWSRPSRRVHTFGRHADPAHPTPAPPAQPRDLIDVVGVGQTETANGVALTLLSLERYREGGIALFRLHRARGPLERDFPSPDLDLAVTPQGKSRTSSG